MAEFSIRQHYRLMYDEPINLGAVQSLTKVYLPIIGRDAFTLYLAWAMMGETPDAQNQHVDLLDQLAISQHDFLSARQNLEGMGLIKTYRQDTSFGSQWVYRLFPPMTMKAFLADTMLSSLLAHYLGDELFQQLVEDIKPKDATIPGVNVSTTFFDMMGNVSFEKLPDAPLSNDDTKSDLQKELHQSAKSVDVALLTDMLRTFGVSASAIRKHEADLTIVKNLYGLGDVDLVRVIQATITPDNGIDMDAIRTMLKKSYQSEQRHQNETGSNKPVESTQNTDVKSPAEAIIQSAKNTAPLVFLKNLREVSGGFVTDAEVKALEDIAQLDKVAPEVLNVMLYELTVVEKKATLNKALLQTIVNDWAQAKVTTAVGALEYLQRRAKSRQTKQEKQVAGRTNRQWQRPTQVKETRPDWENQTASTVSEEAAQAAKDQLAQLRARRQQTNKEN
ncbi:helicase DnaB [Weissella confusa]|uniref:Helicase DnaB n=1 Tax=Weissella confusa TaxID=1583 RepID=A0AAJ2Z0B9_WEICO|nr:DnaD domain protein [Weissella confusa]MBJ7694354.1 helicase DnaB [Weissella confusa]NBA12231.1 helicase DnaB [Weissella confusa]QBZ04754.1 helicase DnaB [Weissella confusa]